MRKIILWLAGTMLCGVSPTMAHAAPKPANRAGPKPAVQAALRAEVVELKAKLAAEDALIAAQNARLDRLEALVQAPALANATPATPSPGVAPPTAASVVVPAAATTPPASASASGIALAASDAANGAVPPAAAPPASPTGTLSLGDTTIGGYGEIAYNAYTHDASRNQADLKRFVLFVGHRFSDKLSFNSEVEVEHAVSSASDKGEMEIEQAWLNYAFRPEVNLKAGLFLMPFGFLNRSHEPPVFYGVERNEVETRIIPSTWREGGVALWGETASGLAYDVGVTTGFDVAKFDDAGYPLTGTHQELQLAKAASISYYASLEYKGIPGVMLGAAIFHGGVLHANADYRQDPTQPDFAGITSATTLWDVHGRWQHRGFDVEALYAHGSYSHADALDRVLIAYNTANGDTRPMVPGAFEGWLVQGAYTLPIGATMNIAPFVRYEFFNTQARLPLGLVTDPANRDRVMTTGFSFHPLSEVVVKVDYQKFLENSANDRVNFGIGYMF